jgi:hypothetical protein
MDNAPQTYSGSLELRNTDGELFGVLNVTIAELDAPVWGVEVSQVIDVRAIDPGGETVMVRLSDPANPRCGDVASAHLMCREGRVLLAGNYGFHAPGA